MAIFNSYVSLPEGIPETKWLVFDEFLLTIDGEALKPQNCLPMVLGERGPEVHLEILRITARQVLMDPQGMANWASKTT